ncbi:MAG: 30S ribosomal protein S20 [Saprospiraceae bacterium]
MANHQSAKKRVRQDAKKRLHNRFYKKTARTAIAKLREMTDKQEAIKFMPKVVSLIDKLVKSNNWHKNKGANVKSKLMKHLAKMS